MELQQLRYFLEAAESQHITKTANKLHIAQPALTQSIHRLENELGVPLFLSKGRGVVLTEYGRYLKERLLPVMKEIDSIPEQMKNLLSLSHQTIHLNVLAASTLMTEAIIEYRSNHSNINFQLMQNEESELFDIGVTTRLFYQPNEDAQNNEYVCTEKIFLAVPKNEKYKNMTSIRLSDAADESFISLLGSRQMRWICDKFCQHAGFAPKIVFESDSPAAVKNMIASNMGVGFWPEFSWGKFDSEHVLLLEITEPVCHRDLLFLCKHNKPDSSNVDDFFKFLKEFCIKRSQ